MWLLWILDFLCMLWMPMPSYEQTSETVFTNEQLPLKSNNEKKNI
jgi:hypothetical protein